jgi:branched-chain amino acid transport system permease protein
MFHQTHLKTFAVAAVVAALALYAIFGGYFPRDIVVEIAMLAILAVSVDFVAGFGGMVSLCHGAIYGIGAYTFAGMTVIAGFDPVTATLAALAATALFGLFVGAVTANISGIFFIMATLAFGQMAYVVAFEWRVLGGDDGLSGIARYDLSAIGLNLNDSLQFALFCLALVVLVYAAAALVLRSTFGRTLSGIHSNEDRMRALGLTVWKHKAVAFSFSSVLAGVAGILAAQHTMFVSPDLLAWTVSGEAMIVVILGGLGTLAGPIVGAALLVLLKHRIGAYTEHWHLVIGLFLIIAIMVGGRGIYGEIEGRLQGRSRGGGDA